MQCTQCVTPPAPNPDKHTHTLSHINTHLLLTRILFVGCKTAECSHPRDTEDKKQLIHSQTWTHNMHLVYKFYAGIVLLQRRTSDTTQKYKQSNDVQRKRPDLTSNVMDKLHCTSLRGHASGHRQPEWLRMKWITFDHPGKQVTKPKPLTNTGWEKGLERKVTECRTETEKRIKSSEVIWSSNIRLRPLSSILISPTTASQVAACVLARACTIYCDCFSPRWTHFIEFSRGEIMCCWHVAGLQLRPQFYDYSSGNSDWEGIRTHWSQQLTMFMA